MTVVTWCSWCLAWFYGLWPWWSTCNKQQKTIFNCISGTYFNYIFNIVSKLISFMCWSEQNAWLISVGVGMSFSMVSAAERLLQNLFSLLAVYLPARKQVIKLNCYKRCLIMCFVFLYEEWAEAYQFNQRSTVRSLVLTNSPRAPRVWRWLQIVVMHVGLCSNQQSAVCNPQFTDIQKFWISLNCGLQTADSKDILLIACEQKPAHKALLYLPTDLRDCTYYTYHFMQPSFCWTCRWVQVGLYTLCFWRFYCFWYWLSTVYKFVNEDV